MSRLLLLALWLPIAAQAQIYKWVDEKGRVQYGERPPPGAKASTLRQEATPPSAPAPAGKASGAADADAEFRRRQIERQLTEDALAQDAKRRQAQCENARNRLAAGEGSGRHFTYKAGEKVYLSDAERDASLARMREQVSQACR